MKEDKNPRTILVRAPNWIGDQVLAYPFFYYLKRAYPTARIVSVCVSWVKDVQFKGLVDDVFVMPRPLRNTLRGKFDVLNEAGDELRRLGPWDLAISLPNSISSAWLLRRSGASRRRGYKVEGRGLLLNDGVRWDRDPERHRAQAYVDLLPAGARPEKSVKEFWGIPAENDLDPSVPGEQESFDAEKFWPGIECVEPPTEPYWVIAPGATADSRRWPLEYVATLARRISEEWKLKGCIVGGPAEAPIASRLCEDRSLMLTDLTAQGPAAGLWKLFRNARFTVTNESGLAHVASLCGSFVQIVCGAADPRRTRPIGPGRVQVAINPVDCCPCERNTCSEPPGQQIRCLRGIQPDAVWEEIRRGTRI